MCGEIKKRLKEKDCSLILLLVVPSMIFNICVRIICGFIGIEEYVLSILFGKEMFIIRASKLLLIIIPTVISAMVLYQEKYKKISLYGVIRMGRVKWNKQIFLNIILVEVIQYVAIYVIWVAGKDDYLVTLIYTGALFFSAVLLSLVMMIAFRCVSCNRGNGDVR